MTSIVILGVLSPTLIVLAGVALLLPLIGPWLFGIVLIRERQVGIVIKRFASRNLVPGRFIALAGEAGYQADTLAPGMHLGLWPWQYRVIKVLVTLVEQGEIAVTGLLDLLKVPYTGGGPGELFIRGNKSLAKKILAYDQLKCPDFAVFSFFLDAREP